jgi:hypothetical protein
VEIKFSRIWAMPSKNTFSIKCVAEFIQRYNEPEMFSIDPFANRSRIAKVTNDIDPDMGCDYNLDALDFLKLWEENSVDLVFFDSPFSPRQVVEIYRKFDKTVNMQTTQSSFWSKLKDEITRITKPNGIVISCGWNSNGIGKKRGFKIEEILLVAHGGMHSDTIVMAERKISDSSK